MPSMLPKLVDPDDPRAPHGDVWEALSAAEREEVIRLLPAEVPWELSPPEGDLHRKAGESALNALDNYFRSQGRSVYLSANLAVYYPGEARFAPDLIAVLDVPTHERMKWVVSAEGKGLDFCLEVLVKGSEHKDLRWNVERYARLGIAEYFVFDVERSRLVGFRAPQAGATYESIVPQAGRWRSEVLGLELTLEGNRVRFYAGSALLLDSEELAERSNRLLAEQIALREREAERAEQEAQRAEQEAQRAAELERRLAAALAEVERLKR
jgi:Uma2 family endonuclease